MAQSTAARIVRYALIAIGTFCIGTSAVIGAAFAANDLLPDPPETEIRMSYREGCMVTRDRDGKLTALKVGTQYFCSRSAADIPSLASQVFHAIKARREVCREKHSTGVRQFTLDLWGRSLDSVCGPPFSGYKFLMT